MTWPKYRRVDVGSGRREADRIRNINIEHIRRNDELQPFPNADFAPQAERLVQKMRHEKAEGGRSRQISEGVRRRIGERALIEVRNGAGGKSDSITRYL